MTFDEQLRQAFDTLTDRLHGEIARQVEAAIAELSASAAAAQESVWQQAQPTEGNDGGSQRLVATIRTIDGARTLSEILDTLVSGAARETERAAVLLVRGGEYRGWRSIGFRPPHTRGEVIQPAADAGVIPIAISGHVVAALYCDHATPALEILARHAARCLESVTAFKAARAALADRSAEPADANGDAHADDDAAARRYARLLVSEIKLYHEADVVAGRRERDLAMRLGGEIARARSLYEQRVPPQVRQQTDYFHDELVRTLANGDAALLELRT